MAETKVSDLIVRYERTRPPRPTRPIRSTTAKPAPVSTSAA
ncbi:unnamed protein product [Oppiella nova]|uniref:Uncharacterized protein n=1 Tax=Oppiella nova TaxID=334625 RepID=A0A7R9ME20_9ACAR|nr:unnamed protein product [Oppiella nova]CAG2175668.1 unnamed protein product [Oppiella nova]